MPSVQHPPCFGKCLPVESECRRCGDFLPCSLHTAKAPLRLSPSRQPAPVKVRPSPVRIDAV